MAQWKESTCRCRRRRLEPFSGKTPRAAEQPGARTLESTPCNERSRHGAKFTHHIWRIAPLATARESLHAAAKTQHSGGKNKIILNE